jgi:hypothetical protein
MEQTVAGPLAKQQVLQEAQRRLRILAKEDAAGFRRYHQQVRTIFPDEVLRFSIRHLAHHEEGPVERFLIAWLAGQGEYMPALLDPDLLPLEKAKRLARLLRERDRNFAGSFSRTTLEGEMPPLRVLERALDLLDELGPIDLYILWLHRLSAHPDERVRSKAALHLVRARPTQMQMEKHLRSEDPRVRANAIEALWGTNGRQAMQMFRAGSADRHHRVVVNSLVGLFYAGELPALKALERLTWDGDPHMRAAAAWAIGVINDPAMTEPVRRLTLDKEPLVRRMAERVLRGMTRETRKDEEPGAPAAKSEPVSVAETSVGWSSRFAKLFRS